jgi:hypothetical protein
MVATITITVTVATITATTTGVGETRTPTLTDPNSAAGFVEITGTTAVLLISREKELLSSCNLGQNPRRTNLRMEITGVLPEKVPVEEVAEEVVMIVIAIAGEDAERGIPTLAMEEEMVRAMPTTTVPVPVPVKVVRTNPNWQMDGIRHLKLPRHRMQLLLLSRWWRRRRRRQRLQMLLLLLTWIVIQIRGTVESRQRRRRYDTILFQIQIQYGTIHNFGGLERFEKMQDDTWSYIMGKGWILIC